MKAKKLKQIEAVGQETKSLYHVIRFDAPAKLLFNTNRDFISIVEGAVVASSIEEAQRIVYQQFGEHFQGTVMRIRAID